MHAIIGLFTAVSLTAASAATLEESFASPPPSARPHTWWHWMNGNISKQGITLDLEAMARVGIGGAQIFNVADQDSCNIPKGPADFLSPLYLELVKHAATEAKRLGIEICLHNCPGWSSSGGPWIDPAHSMQLLVSSEVQATTAGALHLPQPKSKRDFYRDIAVLAFPTPVDAEFRIPELAALTSAAQRYNPPTAAIVAPLDAAVSLQKVVDLTKSLRPDGSLDWSPPAPGAWTIVRFGHTSSGKTNHPASESGEGLECDKLSREAMDLHWRKGIQPILDYLGPVGTHAVNNLLIDSYEVGPETWTPAFREEFTKRRGYDPLPYLPALAGHVLDDGDATARFLWDYRRTIADLFADNYYAYFAELCHKAGLLASTEPYDGPFECLANGRGYDVIMGEFWTNTSTPDPDYPWASTINHSCKIASSVAHVNGKTYVGAESFTSGPPNGRWQNYPGLLKQLGDAVWCLGVNRYIFHRYAHQPWSPEIAPGMTMGQWGTHFDRTNTWWEPAREWMRYIARSQFLLQQGRFGADVVFFGGENAPAAGVNRPELKSAGHDYDAVGTDLMGSLRVENGELVLPGGMRYKMLVLPEEATMTPDLAAKLLKLVENGATLLGPSPLRSPSLGPAARSNALLATSVAALWGNPPAPVGAIRNVGMGHVVHGITPEQALSQLGIAPQVAAPAEIHWIQRITKDHSIFFLSNQSGKAFCGDVGFRVSGMAPSLFDPVTGSVMAAPVWTAGKTATVVTVSLPPAGSTFVVFGPGGPAAPAFTRHTVETLASPPEPPAARPVLTIRAAQYGILRVGLPRCVEVAGQLRDAIKDGSLRIGVTNKLAGDPAKEVPKSLLVEYSAGGQPRRARVAENKLLALPAPGDSGPIEITAALYGDIPQNLDALPKQVVVDVTAKLAAMVRDGSLSVNVGNSLVDKDPCVNVPKQLRVEYTLDGVPGALTVDEQQHLALPSGAWKSIPPTPIIQAENLVSFAKERHTFTKPDATTLTLATELPPPPVNLTGPWQVAFQAKRGAPATATLDRLVPLNEHPDPAIRYFSGTAAWKTTFQIPESALANLKSSTYLDLGRVCVIAEVKLNGHDLGILWHDPFRIDVTRHLQAGSNTLEVAVTNLWVNRLIGDEQLPADVEWNGKPLAQWPEWLVNHQPRPSMDRITFTTWHHWQKDDALKPSGLIGPVLLRYAGVYPLR